MRVLLAISWVGSSYGVWAEHSSTLWILGRGNHVSSLIRSWGPPNQVVSDGARGEIYIWRSRVTYSGLLKERKKRGELSRTIRICQGLRAKQLIRLPSF